MRLLGRHGLLTPEGMLQLLLNAPPHVELFSSEWRISRMHRAAPIQLWHFNVEYSRWRVIELVRFDLLITVLSPVPEIAPTKLGIAEYR